MNSRLAILRQEVRPRMIDRWPAIYTNLLLLVQDQRKSFLVPWSQYSPALKEQLENVRRLGQELNDDRLKIISKAVDRGVIVTNYTHYYDDDLRNLVELYRRNGVTSNGQVLESDTQRLLENIVSIPRNGQRPYQLSVNQQPIYGGWADNDNDRFLTAARNSIISADPTLGQGLQTNWLGQLGGAVANTVGNAIGGLGQSLGQLGGGLGSVLTGALLGNSVNPNWNQSSLTPPLDRAFDQGYGRGLDLVRRSLSDLF